MIPKEQKEPGVAIMGDLTGPVPLLDLGKKLSVPQDLMIEELSLRNNRGSLLFQKRQRRVQRFTFEFAASQGRAPAGSVQVVTSSAEPQTVAHGPEGQQHRSELHVFPASLADPEGAPHRDVAPSPSALAPGYAAPLRAVPPEKFNSTAVPRGYRCPWQEFVSHRERKSDATTPGLRDCRDFNKTPVPFGGLLVGETIPRADTPFVPEPFSGLELLRLRPSFNRVAQGWVRKLPESDEL